MSVLDNLIFGYRKIVGAVEAIARDTVQFVGATVADDPVNKRTVVTVDAQIPAGEEGDMLCHDGTGWVTLSAGGEGQVLTMPAGSATPRWQDPSGGELPSGTTGDLLYYSGTGWVVLPAGTAGNVLVMGDVSTLPEWAAPSGGSSRYDWEEAIEYEVPGGAGAATHTYTTPLPIPATEGAYLVEMEILISRIDEAGVSPGHGIVLTNPLRFALFRNQAGALSGPAGATSIASLWPVAVAGSGSTANMSVSGATLKITDDEPFLSVSATYGTAEQTFRWGAHARIVSANVAA